MNFAEQLKATRDSKVIECADSFLEYIKPKLIESAEKGFSSLSYNIDLDIPSEKEKLQLYSDPLFTEHLNEKLDGVKVEFEREWRKFIFGKDLGYYKHQIHFIWGEK